jgi:hypothetical protein
VISILRRGAAAGGKNYLFEKLLLLVPEESIIKISSSSPMALIYYGNDEHALSHKIVVIAEAASIASKSNGDEHPMAVMLRTLLSEGQIDRIVAIPQPNGPPRSEHVKRRGPVVLLLTSARDNVEPETLTRLMTTDADESSEQTKAVVNRKLGKVKLDPLPEETIEQWRDFQRWLELNAPYDVGVPFAPAIADAYEDLVKKYPHALQLRMRRDIAGLLAAIKASGVLHKAQRERDTEGRIIATLVDYRHAREAFNVSVSSLYGVRTRKEIVAVVKAAEKLGAKEQSGGGESVKITVSAMRKALGISSNDTAANRMREAVEQEALKEDDSKRGTGRGAPRYFWILKSSAELEAEPELGVFPSPDSIEMILKEGGEGQGQRTERTERTERQGATNRTQKSFSERGREAEEADGQNGQNDNAGDDSETSCTFHPFYPSSATPSRDSFQSGSHR